MKLLNIISTFILLLLLISCSENSNNLVNPTPNLIEKKAGLNSVEGGGEAFYIACEAYNQPLDLVMANYTVTAEDILTRGGGTSPMTWTVYSTHDSSWSWNARVFINNEPEPYDPSPMEPSVVSQSIGAPGENVWATFQAVEGDVITLWLLGGYLVDVENDEEKLEKQELTEIGTAYLYLD